ncbi:MAG: Gfo/Idh/MocA family oxidoreductase [Blastocatellia bacterium]
MRSPGRAVLAAGASNWVFEREAGEPFGAPSPFPLDHLIECVEQDRPSPASIQEARQSFRVAVAAYEAAREGRAIWLA